ILLFDGETTFGWTVGGSGPNAKVKAENGSLDFDKFGSGQCTTAFGPWCELTFECKCSKRFGNLELVEESEPKTGVRIRVDAPPPNWTPVAVRVSNSQVTLVSARQETVRELPVGAFTRLAFSQTGKDEANFQVRNLKLRPLKMKPLFNGKDLD